MRMKFNKSGQLLLVSAASLLVASLVTACGTLTTDFVFVTSSRAAGANNYGEVDVFEWYGNGQWAPGTTVHAASNGKTWEGKSIPGLVDGGWHTWRMRWDAEGFKFSRDGAQYFSVPPKPIHVHGGAPDDFRWPFNNPGYWMTPMFTLAVGGVGAGDPAAGTFPANMLVDYIRVW